MGSVLVVRPSSLGDVVHALPIVADMQRHDPDIQVDWIAEEAFASLVRLHPGIRDVIPVGLRRWRRHLLDRDAWQEFTRFRSAVRAHRYCAVLDLQEQVKGAAMARLARGIRHGFDRDSIREPMATFLHDRHHCVPRTLHFEDRCRTLAAAALGYAFAGPPVYGLMPATPPAGTLPAGRYAVAVHATSRDEKLWPAAHWYPIIEAIERAGLAVVLPWGDAAEHARSEALATGHGNTIVPRRESLPVVASLLDGADLVIGVDTGLVHLAAALGTPTVALFTTTDPRRAGVAIAGAHARDLGGNGQVPSVENVLQAMGAVLREQPRC